jgi:hypothetical protein
MFVARAANSGPASQRMYLNTNYSPGTSTAQLTNMTADPGFPATVLSSAKIVVDVAGTINVTALMTLSSVSGGWTTTGYIYLNGAQIASGSRSTAGTIPLSASAVAVNAGDLIDLRAVSQFASTSTVASGSTSTYVEIDPA